MVRVRRVVLCFAAAITILGLAPPALVNADDDPPPAASPAAGTPDRPAPSLPQGEPITSLPDDAKDNVEDGIIEIPEGTRPRLAPVPGAAPGAGTGIGGPGNVSFAADVITFNGATQQGSTSEVTLLSAPFRYRFYDSGGLFAGASCTGIDAFQVDCPAPNTTIINMNLGDGGDVLFVNSIHPVDAGNFYGGPGDDQISIGNIAGLVQGFGATFVSGDDGANDTAYYGDSGEVVAETYTINSTSIAGVGGTMSYNTSTERLQLNAGSSDDRVYVNTLSVILDVFVAGGSDQVNVGAGDLDQHPGITSVYGDNADAVYVGDHLVNYNDTYAITNNSIGRFAFGGVYYYGVAVVELYGQNGTANTYNVSGTSGFTFTIFAGNGADNVIFSNNMSNLGGALQIDTGFGTDAITVTDTGYLPGAIYTVDDFSMARSGSAGVFYLGYESLTLNTSPGPNQVDLHSSIVPTYINGGPSFDGFYPGYTAGFGDLQGAVHINGGGGNDYLQAGDGATTSADWTYTMSANFFGRTGSAGINHADVDWVNFSGGHGNNIINVTSTAPGVLYYVFGGIATDYFEVGPDHAAMLGDLFVSGIGGTDTLSFNDSASPTANTYEVRFNGRVHRVGLNPVNIADFELVQLFGSPQGDTVRLVETRSSPTVNLFLGGGGDVASVFSAGLAAIGSASLNGQSGVDQLFLYTGGTGAFFSGPSTIITPGRHNVSYFEFETATTASTLADSDGDGCTDAQEVGVFETSGGVRNPADFFDFFDVAGPPPTGARDKSIDLQDILAILGKFGLTPSEPEYSHVFDRMIGLTPSPWRSRQATGDAVGIDLQDVLVNLAQFGHSCA